MHWMYESSLYGGPEWFGFGILPIVTIMPLLAWVVAWKGWALYLAARRGELPWFVALLVINTMGILEIFYIFVIAKRSDKKEEETKIVNEKTE